MHHKVRLFIAERYSVFVLLDIRKQLFFVVPLLCSAVLLSSCALINTEPFADTATNSDGEQILADTPRRWSAWTEIVDSQIRAEAAGQNAPGFKTWDEKWITQLRAIRSSQENAQKYILHIVNGREAFNLPKLSETPDA